MNIEQKARAYDEALNWMRELYPGLHGTTKEDAEHYFPELREEEKPLTPFQQCLNCILRGVYYAEVPNEKVNEFIVNVVRTRTDELIKLAKIHEYTDCQLRESEDERIRKEIVSALKFANVGGVYDKHIAYLEKQNHDGKKWITPAELNRLETLRYEAGYKAGFNVGVHSEAEKQKEQKSRDYCSVRDEFDLDGNLKQKDHFRDDTKKVEQKQAQTDDEKGYIRTIKSIISDFVRDKKPEDVAYYQRIYDWLGGRHIEQKHAEKEITLNGFEKVLDSFLFDFVHSPIIDCEPKEYIKNHSAYLLKAAYKELNAQLKQDFFEAQQEGRREGYEAAMAEQNPAEWSEEDDKMLDGTIMWLDDLERQGEYVEKERSWLKSLRPVSKESLQSHWKPSEGQMDALKDIAYGTYQNGDGPALRELYEQLKKLI